MSEVSGGQALVRALADHGVSVLWGIPGTHNLEIYRHLATSSIRHLLPRHEQGAAFAADGYARATGRPGVCVTTSGPAVLNAATALAQSWSDSVPVLLVSAGMPLRHPGLGNGNLHETKDLTAAMNGVVAYSHRVTSVEEIPVAVAQAFATMTSGRARPVHLELPYDVLAEVAHAPRVGPVRPSTHQPDRGDVAEIARLLATADRPMIIAGGGAGRAADEVRRVAEALQAPVVCSINGKGVLADSHPLAMGAGLHRTPVFDLARDCDVALVVGCELAPADLWEGPLPLDGKVVRVDLDSHQLFANAAPLRAVLGDSRAVLASVADLLGTPDAPASRAADWKAVFAASAAAESAPWRHVLDPIARVLGEDGLLVGDSAKVCYLGAVAGLPAAAPGRFLYPTGYGTLGYALPAAVGAKVARPEAPVVCLVGDGGLMFSVAELAAAAEAGVGLPVVVADNGGYGEIRDEMVQGGQEPLGVDLASPNFVGLAHSLGCAAVRSEGGDDLVAHLETALGLDRPTLIHVPTP